MKKNESEPKNDSEPWKADPVTRAQYRQFADHASKSIFPNAFKVIAMQSEEERDLGVQGLANGLSDLVSKMGSSSPYFNDDIGYMDTVINIKFSQKYNVQFSYER